MRKPVTLLVTLLATLRLAPLAAGQVIHPPFSSHYTFADLGLPPGVPGNLGGVAFDPGAPDTLYLGGQAAQSPGAVYRVSVQRDALGHITGFAGNGVKHADAPNLDGGLQFGPGGVLFFTRYRFNELGQIAPGSTVMNKSVPLGPLGVQRSVGGLSFVPAGYAQAGDLKLTSYNGGGSYSAVLTPDGTGTYDVASISGGARIGTGPEALAYPPPGSLLFTDFEHVLVCEYGTQSIVTYHLDPAGEPELATRRVFMDALPGCLGAAVDPVTGDFLFTTWGRNRVYVVQGFGRPCGRTLHYGYGTAGSAGLVPRLTTEGCFARAQTVSLNVTEGLGRAPGAMLIGLQPLDQRIVGIRALVSPLFATPHQLDGTAGTAGDGSYTLPIAIPDSTNLLATDFFFQAVYVDPAGPQGLSATDGIRLDVR